YRDSHVTLDATLDQQPGAQLKAVGTVPFALGRGTTSGNEAVDLRVESTPMVNGSVDIADASFSAPSTGMTYSGGNARLRFDGDHLLIDRFVIEDNDRH